jgi:hypothetical protein
MQSLKGETSVNILKSMYFAGFSFHFKYAILSGEVMGQLKKCLNFKNKLFD